MAVKPARDAEEFRYDDVEYVQPPVEQTPIMLHVQIGMINTLDKGAVEYALTRIGSHWDQREYTGGSVSGCYSFDLNGYRFTVQIDPLEL